MATATLAFVATGVATAYSRLQGNIETADVEELLGGFRPPEPTPVATNASVAVAITAMARRTWWDRRRRACNGSRPRDAACRGFTSVSIWLPGPRAGEHVARVRGGVVEA